MLKMKIIDNFASNCSRYENGSTIRFTGSDEFFLKDIHLEKLPSRGGI